MFKKSVIALILVIGAYQANRYLQLFDDSRLTGSRAPYIQMLTSDSVIIRWLTDDDEIGVLRYGKDSQHLSAIAREDSPRKDHAVTLRHLQPATEYIYQTGTIDRSDALDAKRDRFETAPAGIAPTRVWVIGDSGEPGEGVRDVKSAALSWMKRNPLVSAQSAAGDWTSNEAPPIDIWIGLGDLAYEFGTNEQYQAAFFDVFDDLTGNTALWPVYGNHDDRRWTYFEIFNLPENGEAGGLSSHTENYYAIDYSNIHFVMLDSEDSDRSSSGEMATWLEDDLAQNTRPWVIAAFHHPPYSRGHHDSDDEEDSEGKMEEMRENILPILEQGGVDVVLSGHSHSYERSYLIDCAYQESEHFSPSNIVSTGINHSNRHYVKPLNERAHQGAVYIVAGSSSKVGGGTLDHPAHHVGLNERGSVVIDVSGTRLVSRFINAKGEIKDEFSISKEAGFASQYKACR